MSVWLMSIYQGGMVSVSALAMYSWMCTLNLFLYENMYSFYIELFNTFNIEEVVLLSYFKGPTFAYHGMSELCKLHSSFSFSKF